MENIEMLIKKVEYISVCVSEENGYDVPDEDATQQDIYDYIKYVENNYTDFISDVDYAEAETVFELESFKVV